MISDCWQVAIYSPNAWLNIALFCRDHFLFSSAFLSSAVIWERGACSYWSTIVDWQALSTPPPLREANGASFSMCCLLSAISIFHSSNFHLIPSYCGITSPFSKFGNNFNATDHHAFNLYRISCCQTKASGVTRISEKGGVHVHVFWPKVLKSKIRRLSSHAL